MKKNADEDRGMDTGLKVPGRGRSRLSIRPQTFSSLKNPAFRLYYGGMIGQWGPLNMELVVRSLLIYRLTGSAAILGGMSLAQALPMLFLSLFGGVIADRVQKKYVLLVGQICSALVSLGVALSLTLGYLNTENTSSWWILILAAILKGAILGFMMPSRQAILREIVGGEQLMNAVALNNLGMNAIRLMAPAAAGFLTDAFDFEAVYYVMTGLYLISVVFFVFLPLTSTTTSRGINALAEIKEGIKYIRRETTILLILGFFLFVVVLAMPYMFLMPVFTEDVLKVGASGMGILISVSGAGAIAGGLILASLPNKKRGLMLLANGVVLGLALTGFSFSSSWHLSLALIVFVGLGQAGQMTLSNSLLQYYTEDKYQGRVMSFYMMNMGLQSLGTFGAGLLADAIGVQWVLGGFAMVLILLSILGLSFLPRIRKLD